jgi:hypothetical protein
MYQHAPSSGDDVVSDVVALADIGGVAPTSGSGPFVIDASRKRKRSILGEHGHNHLHDQVMKMAAVTIPTAFPPDVHAGMYK